MSIGCRQRFEILKRDGFRCQYCGASSKDGAVLHVDHIEPRSKGGNNLPSNLTTACEVCNLGKSDVELDIRLREMPEIPEQLIIDCAHCKTNVVVGWSDRLAAGKYGAWLVWYVDTSNMCYEPAVRCNTCHGKSCKDDPGLPDMRDIPLEWASGARAIARLFRVVTDRQWHPEPREAFFDLLFKAQFLPTWEGKTPAQLGMK